MSDILIQWDSIAGRGTFVLDPVHGTLETGDDLVTAVIVSLFSDRLAQPGDELAPGDDNRRGWYGDTFLQIANPGDLIGSRLWLLERSKSNDRTPLIARGYIREALQWLLDDRVASRIDIDTFFIGGNQRRLGGVVEIFRQDGRHVANLEFDWAWQQIGSA